MGRFRRLLPASEVPKRLEEIEKKGGGEGVGDELDRGTSITVALLRLIGEEGRAKIGAEEEGLPLRVIEGSVS